MEKVAFRSKQTRIYVRIHKKTSIISSFLLQQISAEIFSFVECCCLDFWNEQVAAFDFPI